MLVPVLDFYRGRSPFQTPGGPFRSLSIKNQTSFARNSLTGSPISAPSVHASHSTLELGACTGFGFPRARFPFRNPGGPFWSLSIGNHTSFARNSLTGSPIRAPSVPTSYSTLGLSGHAGFGFLPRPFLVPGPRRAILEPKYQKSEKFHS